eukprot:CAMPEP_0113704588 /NCGR_PEP_ID=MMETSP0038_2-20120614/26607_1 /TAXON_ID=2898 /ORGANISM="Cryptomonas paramecium" /LENGTH=395 /DNA_ID=CAMNT_0000629395 /DNA_START=24 /DNA_END=1208 /DNA_ORIENTATION=+ /assembly_acc=CAM_ASM_000170
MKLIICQLDSCDASKGYKLSDASSKIAGRLLRSQADLESAIGEGSYSFSLSGHDIAEFPLDKKYLPTVPIFAIQRDPIVRVVLQGEVCFTTVSKDLKTAVVGDAKKALRSQGFSDVESWVLIGSSGAILNDSSALKDNGVFGLRGFIFGKPQLQEYFSLPSHSDQTSAARVQSAAAHAREVQENSLSSSTLSADVNALREQLSGAYKVACKGIEVAILSARPKLESFVYDKFIDSFPSENRPPRADSKKLEAVKQMYQALTRTNSECPGAALTLIDSLMKSLQRTNAPFADQAAELLQRMFTVIQPLADKEPALHNHRDFRQRLEDMERAVRNFRDIKVQKLYSDPREFQERKEALAALEEEIKKAPADFGELLAAWQGAQAWADLSSIDAAEAA